MTLCIAAECEYKGKTVIALCADSRAQTGNPLEPDSMIGNEDIYKILHYGKAAILLAGSHAAAIELATACKPVIREFTEQTIDQHDLDIAVDGFLSKLRKVAAAKKMELVERYVENTVGVPHQQFLRLPTDQYTDVWHSVRNLTLQADILICYVTHNAVIVKLDRWGDARWIENYAAIGSGADTARAMLSLQEWNPVAVVNEAGKGIAKGEMMYIPFREVPLEECLFRLSEAHFAAHSFNPSSVGASVCFEVLNEEFRAIPQSDYVGMIQKMVDKKHRVPPIASARNTNELVNTIFSNTTGEVMDDPNEW